TDRVRREQGPSPARGPATGRGQEQTGNETRASTQRQTIKTRRAGAAAISLGSHEGIRRSTTHYCPAGGRSLTSSALVIGMAPVFAAVSIFAISCCFVGLSFVARTSLANLRRSSPSLGVSLGVMPRPE